MLLSAIQRTVIAKRLPNNARMIFDLEVWMLMKSAVIGLLLAPVVRVTEIQCISICCGQQPCFCSELDILICTERPRSQFEQTGLLVLAAIVLELEIEPVSYLS